MTPERWQQVEAVFQAVLDRPPLERDEFLDELCAGDEELKDEAASLITAHTEAGDFIEQPALARDAHVIVSGSSIKSSRIADRYKIVERLGTGGMSEVYLAQDERLNRLVALKILPAYFVSDDERLRRFQKEARAASSLNHPNLLTVYEVGEHERIHFIAAEFIEGRTIRELIAERGLSLDQVIDIAAQVCTGLAAAHSAGIVHRDIKPENIMLRADGIAKILDFGIAKLTEKPAHQFSSEASTIMMAQTEVGVIMGTVGYMSPEQARGLQVDQRTDLWSLGCVLYEMISGRAPFASATRVDTLVGILEREPVPLSEIVQDRSGELRRLERVISKALCKDGDRRYQTANELLDELNQLRYELSQSGKFTGRALYPVTHTTGTLEDRNVSPRTSESITGREGIQARSRRPQLWLAIVAIGALMAAIGGGLFYQLSKQHRTGQNGASSLAAITKPYAQMSDAEQMAFVEQQEQRISAMMGDRPVKLNEEALRAIKVRVDRYVQRTASTSKEFGKENLHEIYSRPIPYVPMISRSFAARKVPVIIGLYLPMIEAEYEPCKVSSIGAKGLFQFLPGTAKQYGVAAEDMCNAEKMAPAAAHYIADGMAELGDDSQSMTLVLVSYNRGAGWVRDTLRQLRETEGYERNFWTMFAHRNELDETFRKENAAYVPAFFAAAIVGENPQAFGLSNPPLSTLAATGTDSK